MPNKITGIILAAGLSSRMRSFKPLLTLKNGDTFISHLLTKLEQVCSEIIVVSGHDSEKLNYYLNKNVKVSYKTVYNKEYLSGMFSSLKAALRSNEADWYLYHFVDQPSLSLNFYKNLIDGIDKGINWIQPVNNGKKGHPILFNNYVKKLILESNNAANLREVNKNRRIIKKYIEFESSMIFQDIDNPDDYNKMV